MRNNLKGLAGNLLFALNTLILFLLVFESKILVPQWLQPIGRMHPLMLHFPIVILILSMALEFFRYKEEYGDQGFYKSFTSNLLLIGAISSAVTVIMGLFLAKEEGYSGSILQWHKWTGVSIVFIASLIYWYRDANWYKPRVAKGAALLTIFMLIAAGHYGAALTHGEDFVLGPVMSTEAEQIPIEEAAVYEHVVKPIFEAKCTSCHNTEKIKGELLLTDPEAIMKGGKTGKLIIPGKPELSLLLQRIHLPEEDKKHMPPKGKVQLTEQETLLLHLWVKANADFKKKVVELPENDSLRIIAASFLKPAVNEDRYDFAAADDNTVKKLSNDYRVILPLAKESPALKVNLYNPAVYTPKAIEELAAIKEQVISLSLNKMPVTDAELKTIAQFTNLRHLNLNFTDVTGKGLQYLAPLKYLKSLSLAGTKVSYNNLSQLSAIKSLKQVAIWNTSITSAETKQLDKAHKGITFIAGYKDDGKPIKLNPPQLKSNGFIIQNSLPADSLGIKHPIKGVEIRYTTDGSEPDSVSALLEKGVHFTKNTTLKMKAFKRGWLSSQVVTADLFKGIYKPDSLAVLTTIAMSYNNGKKRLIDGQLGGMDVNSDSWLGLQGNTELAFFFDKPVTLSSILFHSITVGLFGKRPPEIVEVWGGANKSQMQLLSTVKPQLAPGENRPSFITVVECKLKPKKIAYLHIKTKSAAIFLVDEIFFN
ncbi:cytochrome C [Mucilaginibacter hurinus]|uniref:Cytochrome C n=1 Tax=Mucilaginibacter hurinus TaxID=2201324 RepID=A0A367GJL0_9SPHI|nr:c-type cytochrome domain-containing protein [Mucilaginibacter hurinus]RCH53659.1 cytochrome C [Mucilaginibacter hurinus]